MPRGDDDDFEVKATFDSSLMAGGSDLDVVLDDLGKR